MTDLEGIGAFAASVSSMRHAAGLAMLTLDSKLPASGFIRRDCFDRLFNYPLHPTLRNPHALTLAFKTRPARQPAGTCPCSIIRLVSTTFRQNHRRASLSPVLRFLIVRSRPSIVRFRLPLTPPQQVDMPPKYKEVSTKDAAPEVLKLKDWASRWGKRDLELLGVDYQYDKFEEVKIPASGMPQELVAGIFPSFRYLIDSHRS